mmetsp:Transcript_22787/g.35080  ORF Transcript_22787/g.35080 Transcript_22787/m.35080 type:complete len:100 (+) Transcript_22787:3972-4271(+)
MFRTVEECFESQGFKHLMTEVVADLREACSRYPFEGVKVGDVVLNFALPPGHCPSSSGVQFVQISITKSNKIVKSDEDYSREEQLEDALENQENFQRQD